MDLDEVRDIDIPDIHIPDIDLPDDTGGSEPPDPPPPGGGGGDRGGGQAVPSGDPFLNSHWTSLVAVLVVGFFGLQSVAVVWLARSGMGDETSTLALAGVFIVAFTVLFIAGARFIGRHRH